MNKIINANFARLWKSKFFWIGSGFMFVMGFFVTFMSYVESLNTDYETLAQQCILPYILYLSIVTSVFSGLFIGVDYANGTIRNKVVVGHKRSSIYFANLLVSIAAQVLFALAYLIPSMVLGIILLKKFTLSAGAILLLLLAGFVLTCALTAIFTMITMVCKNRTITEIICIIGIFFLLLAASYINSRLQEPEFYSGYTLTDEHGTLTESEEPNPNFLRGNERKVYEFLFDFLPGCQILQLTEGNCSHLGALMIYSGMITVIITGLGIYIFSKKDLN